MERLLSRAVAYLAYLNGTAGLRVSVHFTALTAARLPAAVLTALHPYNLHTPAYCTVIKQGCRAACIENQREVMAALAGVSALCHTCHAGVSEYILPITANGEAVGYLAAGGYRAAGAECPTAHAALYAALTEGAPPAVCDTLLSPLAVMLGELFRAAMGEAPSEYHRILQFLREFHVGVTVGELARRFHCSPSHISHLFKRESGMSIRAFCNLQKLADAERLLRGSERTVSEIAYDVGFCDPSYFISLFKKQYGLSPLAYRRQGK